MRMSELPRRDRCSTAESETVDCPKFITSTRFDMDIDIDIGIDIDIDVHTHTDIQKNSIQDGF